MVDIYEDISSMAERLQEFQRPSYYSGNDGNRNNAIPYALSVFARNKRGRGSLYAYIQMQH